MILFLTDGFREAMNHSHEQFGVERMIDVVGRNVRSSARNIFETLRNEVESFAGSSTPRDDMTGVIVRVEGG